MQDVFIGDKNCFYSKKSLYLTLALWMINFLNIWLIWKKEAIFRFKISVLLYYAILVTLLKVERIDQVIIYFAKNLWNTCVRSCEIKNSQVPRGCNCKHCCHLQNSPYIWYRFVNSLIFCENYWSHWLFEPEKVF